MEFDFSVLLEIPHEFTNESVGITFGEYQLIDLRGAYVIEDSFEITCLFSFKE